MEKIILYPDSIQVSEMEIIGGKAKQLHWLSTNKFNVPKWAVVPFNRDLSGLDLKEVQAYFDDNVKLAVRSSALEEDGIEHSFAGQFSSKLNVNVNNLREAIEEVRNSAQNKSVQTYDAEKGTDSFHKVSVVIQEMISPDSAGVMFSKHPSNGDDVQIINSVFGLGEGIVNGDINADQFIVSGGKIESKLADKKIEYVNDENDGLVINPLNGRSTEPSLNEVMIFQLKDIALDIENQTGLPQDIEFCVKNKQVFILQTRPITTIRKKGEYTVYDNSNIIESYPGISSVLTFSFIEKMYEAVYKQLVGLFGVQEKVIEKNSYVFENTLAHVRGRVFYNLLSWYKMLAMVPGYSLNARYMENMMGIKEKFELKENFRMSKSMAWWRILVMLVKMIRLNWKLEKDSEKFNQHVDLVLREYKAIDFHKKSFNEIIDLYKAYERNLLDQWKPPMVNDFFAMIFFGLLQKQCLKLSGKETTNLHNELLCGSNDIISTEPIHQTIKIVKYIQEKPELVEFYKCESYEKIWSEIKLKDINLYKKIEKYINIFGDRCVGELKLENKSYTDHPEEYIKVIQSYIGQSFKESSLNENIDQKIRSKAEEEVKKLLKAKPLKKWVFNGILRKTRQLVSNRENLRFQRTRAFGTVRTMMNAVGKALENEGILSSSKDVFYLKLDEILALQNERKVLIDLIQDRKREFQEYENQKEPSARFFTYGKDFSDEYIYSDEKVGEAKMELEGIGCSPGKVRGKVKVVYTPEDLTSLNGDILVTRSTDPGWVPLFPTCSALLVERGSLLSHSAIVSREMGIPCIVGIDDLLLSLKTGDEVIMNGETGEIKVING